MNLNLITSKTEAKAIEEATQKILNLLNQKRDEINKLSESINNFSKNFENTFDKINEVFAKFQYQNFLLNPVFYIKDIEYINNLKYEHTDEELDQLLSQISELAETVNFSSIQQEANINTTAANKLLQNVDSTAVHSAGINKSLDTLVENLEKKAQKISENEENIEKLIKENSSTKDSVQKVKFTTMVAKKLILN